VAGKVYRAYNEKLFREKLESFLKEVNPSPETKEKFAQQSKAIKVVSLKSYGLF
jgi:hypothetical protein